MNTKFILIVLAFALAVAITATATHGCDKPTERVIKVIVSDTVKISAVHDTLRDVHTRIVTIAGADVHDTTYAARDIQHALDSALTAHGIRELRACADTVAQGDSIHVCYTLPAQAFTLDIRFAPRVHDTALSVVVRPHAIASHLFAVADVDLNSQVFAGAGYAVELFDKLELSGAIGLQRAPLQANAHLQARWNF